MSTTMLIVCALVLSLTVQSASAAEPTENNTGKVGPNKGLTLEDVGRGLKSPVQNIEKEIPKIGPAIGETFKKVTGKEQSSQSSPKEKK